LRREFGWPLTELGHIRLRKGDIQGAEEAFLAAHRAGWDPEPGLALVHLAHGDVARAAASIREALDSPALVPSKEWPPNSKLRRAPLLEAQVEIAIAAGDVESARLAAEELGQIAATFQSSGMAASATLARGHVRFAEGDPVGARREFEAAAHQWSEIGAPYETALARMGSGRSLRTEGQEQRARLEFQAARTTFERIGAISQAARAAAALGHPAKRHASAPAIAADAIATPDNSDRGGENAFHHEGDYWSLAFDGRVARVRDSRGLRYLARLLAEPGREVHVLDLVAAPSIDSSTAGDAGELLDARAKAAYRRRLAEIDEDLAEAQATGETARAAQAEAERDILMRELARAVGLGGRSRRAGSASERARSAVTRAVRHALARVRKHHVTLGDYLERTIRTGTYCVYLPDPRYPIAWKF
jgi:hypothetical protein